MACTAKAIRHPAERVTAACEYAARGWPVLPLHSIKDGFCTCGKSCRSPGKHPHTRKGLKDATTNTGKINQWWKQWPDANVGILTGRESGLLVLDVDPRNGGDETLSGLVSEYGSLPETLEAETGGGGFHILFAYPEKTVKGGNGKLGPGLDVKSDGGYIVASPSNHISGGVYEWLNIAPLASIPEWLLRLLGQQQVDSVPSDGLILEGNRNNALASIGGRLRGQGKERKAIEVALLEANAERCSPPLHQQEILRIAKSICRYKKGETKPVHIWRDLIRSVDGPEHSTTRHILYELSSFMDSDGRNCYPTHKTLELTTAINRKTIGKHLREACNDGWIKIVGYKGEGQQWRNHIYSARLPPKVVIKHNQLLKEFWPKVGTK